MAKLAEHLQILVDDRLDMTLDSLRLVLSPTELRLPKPRPAVRGGVSNDKLGGFGLTGWQLRGPR
jgi:hypothetical protein